MNVINFIDDSLFALLDKIRCPLIDKAMVFFSTIGDVGLVWLLISIVFLFAYKYSLNGRHFRVGLSTCLSLGSCAYLGNVFIKPLFARVRPCNLHPEVELLIRRPTGFSFPSMHAATAFSVAIILYLYDKRIGIPALVIAVLISLSRVYLFVHYATDIIAGAVLGSVFALAFYFVFFMCKRKKKNT